MFALSARKSLFYCHCVCEQAQTQCNIHDETTYIPLWLKSLCWDEFLYPTPGSFSGGQWFDSCFCQYILIQLIFGFDFGTLDRAHPTRTYKNRLSQPAQPENTMQKGVRTTGPSPPLIPSTVPYQAFLCVSHQK